MIDRPLTASEVAEHLSVPERWVREHTRSGSLPHIKLGRYRRYDLDDVLALVEECKSGGRPTTFRKRHPVPRGRYHVTRTPYGYGLCERLRH